MLSHLSFGVADLARAAAFYDGALAALGYVRVWSNEDDGLATRHLETAIARVGRSASVPGKADDGVGILRGDQRRLIRARIVDDDELPAISGEIASDDRIQTRSKRAGTVVRGDDHRQVRPPYRR